MLFQVTKYTILFFLLLAPSSSFAFELGVEHPFFTPKEKEFYFFLEGGSGHKTIEYESHSQKIDEQTYKTNEIHLKTLYTPIDRITVGVQFSYDADRNYELKYYEGSSNYGQSPYQSSASGLLDPEIILIYEFYSRRDNWNQQFYFNANPFDIKERPKRIYRGGNDFKFEYRFSHYYESGNLYGDLFSHYYGKKDFYLPGDSRLSHSEPYTEVGIKAGYLVNCYKPLSFFADGTFGLSSDYKVTTPDIERSADKGYLLLGSAGVNYSWSKDLILKIKYSAGVRNYNVDNEELSRNIEYAIEESSLFFGMAYSWDPK